VIGGGRMTFGPSGRLYFCDELQIKSYSFESGSVSLIAGNGKHGATQVGTHATSSLLKYPQSITVGADETVYFSTLEPAVYRVAQKVSLSRLVFAFRMRTVSSTITIILTPSA